MTPGRKFSIEHVAVLGEVEQDRRRARLGQVEADVALARVLLHEVGGEPVDARRCESRQITGGRLDLDHVGAEIGEHPGAMRTRQHAREVEDSDPVERCRDPVICQRSSALAAGSARSPVAVLSYGDDERSP